MCKFERILEENTKGLLTGYEVCAVTIRLVFLLRTKADFHRSILNNGFLIIFVRVVIFLDSKRINKAKHLKVFPVKPQQPGY